MLRMTNVVIANRKPQFINYNLVGVNVLKPHIQRDFGGKNALRTEIKFVLLLPQR
jgi:hypothetical protein